MTKHVSLRKLTVCSARSYDVHSSPGLKAWGFLTIFNKKDSRNIDIELSEEQFLRAILGVDRKVQFTDRNKPQDRDSPDTQFVWDKQSREITFGTKKSSKSLVDNKLILNPGESFFVASNDKASLLKITFGEKLVDTNTENNAISQKLIKFKSDSNDSYEAAIKISALTGPLKDSPIIKGVMNEDFLKYRSAQEHGKVFLSLSPQEIIIFKTFLESNLTQKENLLEKISIIKNLKLLEILHLHCSFTEFSNKLIAITQRFLEKKIFFALKKACEQPRNSWATTIKWFDKIQTLNLNAIALMKKTLENVVNKIPQVLVTRAISRPILPYYDSVQSISYSKNKKWLIINYKTILSNYRINITDVQELESGRTVFRGKGIENIVKINFDETEKKMAVAYNKANKLVEIRDLTTIDDDGYAKVIFRRKDIERISFNLTGTQAIIHYNRYRFTNRKPEIIYLEEDNIDLSRVLQNNDASVINELHKRYIPYPVQFENFENIGTVLEVDGNGPLKALFQTDDTISRRHLKGIYLDSAGKTAAFIDSTKSLKIVNLETNKSTFYYNLPLEINLKPKSDILNLFYSKLPEKYYFRLDAACTIMVNSSYPYTSLPGGEFHFSGQTQIINLENRNVILKGHNITVLHLESDNPKAIVLGKNWKFWNNSIKGKLIDLKSGKILFQDDIKCYKPLDVSLDGTRVIALHEDNSVKVVEIETGKVLLEKDNVSQAYFANSSGTRVVISNIDLDYEKDQIELIDLDHKEKMNFTNLTKEDLLLTFRQRVLRK